MSFRDRLLGTSLTADATPNRTLRSYYDDDLVSHQFGGKRRQERKAEYYDDTLGYGAAETQPDGSVVARDPKTKERRTLTPSEVDKVFLTR